MHLNGQLAQFAQGRIAQAFGQLRQKARGRFDQHDLQVFFRVDVVEAEIGQHLGRRMEFGGQLHTGGATTDNGHGQAPAAGAARHGLCPYAGVDQAVVETFGRLWTVQLDRVLGRTQGAEVVGLAAHGNHQRVVAQLLRRRDLAPGLVVAGGQLQGLGDTVHAFEAAEAELEMVPACLRQVLDFLGVGVKTASCQLVQQRFPHMGARGVHQRDFGLAFFAQTLAQLRGQRQPACAAADDDDTLHEFPPRHQAAGSVVVARW